MPIFGEGDLGRQDIGELGHGKLRKVLAEDALVGLWNLVLGPHLAEAID